MFLARLYGPACGKALLSGRARQHAIDQMRPVCTWSPRETEWGCLQVGAFSLVLVQNDSQLIVYKHSLDTITYMVGSLQENELMLQAALTSYFDALSLLFRNQVEKRSILESLDLVMLCLDETIDDG